MKQKIIMIIIAIVIVATPSIALAHSGKTDANGGHNDYSNESGLGDYHYHHGYGPHLHPNGVCPYASSTTISSSDDDDYAMYTTKDGLFETDGIDGLDELVTGYNKLVDENEELNKKIKQLERYKDKYVDSVITSAFVYIFLFGGMGIAIIVLAVKLKRKK